MPGADIDARNRELAAWADEHARALRLRPSDAAAYMRRHRAATLRALRAAMPDADAIDVAAAIVHASEARDEC